MGDRGRIREPVYTVMQIRSILPPSHLVFIQVSCALLEILTDSVCQEAVQELYPRLLLAVLCHVYWAAEKNSPQQMVVYRKMGDQDSKSKSFDPLR